MSSDTPTPPQPALERITGVALLFSSDPDDMVSLDAPGRHHELISDVAHLGFPPRQIAMAQQGFVTSAGRFVSRHDAVRIAEAAGQIIRRTAPAHGLFSEDMW